MPERRSEIVQLEGEPLEVVRQRFEVNGWDFEETIQTLNDGLVARFSKPADAPDTQPFVSRPV